MGYKWSNGLLGEVLLAVVILTHRSRSKQPKQRSKLICERMRPKYVPQTSISALQSGHSAGSQDYPNHHKPSTLHQPQDRGQASKECDFFGPCGFCWASNHCVTTSAGNKLIFGGGTRVIVKLSEYLSHNSVSNIEAGI